ncbi:sugar phosphate nucleotidyltransferase [Zooshikella sp. RANM57]|uniref:sugar phosphate nucleotidyltransferase n=1 Tax=Zooshikella sp. RANM57 TaxID=3425863 RepID=UPI003D6DFF98
MQAIVFANRHGNELNPLNEYSSPAMLPVLGKPVLEHCLEELNLNNVKEVFLVINSNQEIIKNHFQSGLRWSLNINYIEQHINDSPDKIKDELSEVLNFPFIVARGDIVRGTHEWNLSNEVVSTAYTNLNNKFLGLIKVYSKDCSIDCIGWPLTHPKQINTEAINCTLENFLIDSPSSYHQLVLNESTNIKSLIPSGIKQSFNLITGKRSLIQLNSLMRGKAFVGDHSYIDKGAQLIGHVSIGNDCFIDRGAKIINSIILDDTYVGADVEIMNAIVFQNKVIRVDLAINSVIRDSFILTKNTSSERGCSNILKIINMISKLLKPFSSFLIKT